MDPETPGNNNMTPEHYSHKDLFGLKNDNTDFGFAGSNIQERKQGKAPRPASRGGGSGYRPENESGEPSGFERLQIEINNLRASIPRVTDNETRIRQERRLSDLVQQRRDTITDANEAGFLIDLEPEMERQLQIAVNRMQRGGVKDIERVWEAFQGSVEDFARRREAECSKRTFHPSGHLDKTYSYSKYFGGIYVAAARDALENLMHRRNTEIGKPSEHRLRRATEFQNVAFMNVDNLDDEMQSFLQEEKIFRKENQPRRRGAEAEQADYELWNDDQYITFLNIEQWGGRRIQPVDKLSQDTRRWPSYYQHLTAEQKSQIDARVELSNAVTFKYTSKDANLETLSSAQNESMRGLSKNETRVLYEIPGVKDALRIYLSLVEENTQLFDRVNTDEKYSIRQCKDNAEILKYRDHVRNEIKKAVHEDMIKKGRFLPSDPDELDKALNLYARDAEQVAMSLHRLGNTFESKDSIWEKGKNESTRTRPPEISSVLIAPIVRAEMNPIDGFLYNTLTEGKSSESIARWANLMVNKIKRRMGVQKLKDFEEVTVVGYKDHDKYFTTDRKGKHIYIPNCRPAKLLGSIWEETKIDDIPLIEYIRDGEEIPWETPGTQDLWGGYAGRMEKVSKLLKFFGGQMPIKWQDEINTAKWTTDVTKAFADLGFQDMMKEYMPWVVAASVGIQYEDRTDPRINTTISRKALVDTFKQTKLWYECNVFFPWNKVPIIKQILGFSQ